MKNTEIIVMNTINPAPSNFKDDRLAKATQRIIAIYNDAAKYADTKNREIAKILGDVSEKKAYEADGFKSVADYAATVFGIAHNNAYSLARAGRIYNDKDAHPELKAMSPSKLAAINSVDDKVVIEAIESGKINHDTTQKDLRAFADEVKHDKEMNTPIVLNYYTARPCIPVTTEENEGLYNQPKTLDEWDEFFTQCVKSASPEYQPEVIKLPKGRPSIDISKATINRRLYMSRGYSIVVEYFKYVPAKPTKTAKKTKYTADELRKMLAEVESEGNEVEEQK